MSKSSDIRDYSGDVIIRLLDPNEGIIDRAPSNRMFCSGIQCISCPMVEAFSNTGAIVTLGELRKLDPRLVTGVAKDTTKPLKSPVAEYNGGSSDYYQVEITSTTTEGRPAYIAECNDIIEALGMNFAEGNAFKALWRRAAQRTLGKRKAGAKDDGLYDAQKVEFFGARMVAQSKGLADESK